MPEPISTAPTNGTPILTDEGFVVFKKLFKSPGGWISCDPTGDIFGCYDCGMKSCKPTLWEPVPQWIIS